MISFTCIAPVNIALIKYWGKRNDELILPVNDSISMTLSTTEMCAKTTVAASEDFQQNTMWLNGIIVPFEENPRIKRCLEKIKEIALAKNISKFPINWKLHVVSRNNFPTAAGLASSAAGYACLVYALSHLYGIENEELTSIARLGSGSASRSLYGGFVQWHSGTLANGNDSIAVQVVTHNHWPNMHVLILVVNDENKKVGSTVGMKRAVETSDLIKYRVKYCIPERIAAITEAIQKRDFAKFAEITMKDSNQFHAITLDSYPPCIYMNETSHAIIDFVHEFNKSAGKTKVAYTFDAGPNACLYLLEEDVPSVLVAIKNAFHQQNCENNHENFIQGIKVELKEVDDSPNNCNAILPLKNKNILKYIIHTKIGSGPHVLSNDESLLDLHSGLPFTVDK